MKTRFFGVVLGLLLCGAQINAAPQEAKSQRLTRSAQSSNLLKATLSENIYRQEAYDAEYTVQVPYQAQETYTVDVPYQETVPYTDYEDYYEQEYSCRNVTRYREQCRNEQLCTPVAGRCQSVEECGTNALGQRICKVRQVCEAAGRECRDVRQCQQVPYTDQDCGYQNVRKSRPVTRYRTETRYRQETRTRTVTRYREETRCCETRYKSVFDRQRTLAVEVEMQGAFQLIGSETETVLIALAGSESSPDVTVTIQNPIYKYRMGQKTFRAGVLKVQVIGEAPFDMTTAGVQTIQDLKMQFVQDQAILSFKDTLAANRMETQYQLQLFEGGQLILEETIMNDQKLIKQLALEALDRLKKYEIRLSVQRKSALLKEGQIAFEKLGLYEKIELTQSEIQGLSDKSLVQITSLDGLGAQSVLRLEDLTLDLPEVETTYKVVVWKVNGGKLEWLGEKTLSREQITTADGLQVRLLDAGVKEKTLDQVVISRATMYFDVVVRRKSSQYLGTQTIQFITNKRMSVR